MDGQCKKIIKMIYDTSNDQKDIIIKTTSFLNFESNTKNTSLGNQIQNIRRKKGIKASSLISDLNIARNTLTRIETDLYRDKDGVARIDKQRLKHFKQIINYLDIQDELIFNDEYVEFLIKDYGQAIIQIREILKIKKIDLANKLNVNRNTITSWEQEKCVIPEDKYIELKKMLDQI